MSFLILKRLFGDFQKSVLEYIFDLLLYMHET